MGESLVERILARLEAAEARETNPHFQDDYRIAWITVLHAARGEADPHFWATYTVLRTAPDQVWPIMVKNRKAKLGLRYEEFFGVELPPKKPAGSVRLPRKAFDRAA